MITEQTSAEIRHLELTITSMEDECHSLRYERDSMEGQLDGERQRATKQENIAKRGNMDSSALYKTLQVTKDEKNALAEKVAEMERLSVLEREQMQMQLSSLRAELRQKELEHAEMERLSIEAEREATRRANMRVQAATEKAEAAAAEARRVTEQRDQERMAWEHQEQELKQEIDNQAKAGATARAGKLLQILEAKGLRNPKDSDVNETSSNETRGKTLGEKDEIGEHLFHLPNHTQRSIMFDMHATTYHRFS